MTTASVIMVPLVMVRIGGDEFVVLWTQPDDETARVLADRLAQALLEPVDLDGAAARVGASIGVITGTGPAIGAGASLLSSADTAMYRAKRAARLRADHARAVAAAAP
jgi:diguanylate cyclase (GGDEF)-like protein